MSNVYILTIDENQRISNVSDRFYLDIFYAYPILFSQIPKQILMKKGLSQPTVTRKVVIILLALPFYTPLTNAGFSKDTAVISP